MFISFYAFSCIQLFLCASEILKLKVTSVVVSNEFTHVEAKLHS